MLIIHNNVSNFWQDQYIQKKDTYIGLHLSFKIYSCCQGGSEMIFALCSISLIKMSSYNITLGKNGPNLILLNINNVI